MEIASGETETQSISSKTTSLNDADKESIDDNTMDNNFLHSSHSLPHNDDKSSLPSSLNAGRSSLINAEATEELKSSDGDLLSITMDRENGALSDGTALYDNVSMMNPAKYLPTGETVKVAEDSSCYDEYPNENHIESTHPSSPTFSDQKAYDNENDISSSDNHFENNFAAETRDQMLTDTFISPEIPCISIKEDSISFQMKDSFESLPSADQSVPLQDVNSAIFDNQKDQRSVIVESLNDFSEPQSNASIEKEDNDAENGGTALNNSVPSSNQFIPINRDTETDVSVERDTSRATDIDASENHSVEHVSSHNDISSSDIPLIPTDSLIPPQVSQDIPAAHVPHDGSIKCAPSPDIQHSHVEKTTLEEHDKQKEDDAFQDEKRAMAENLARNYVTELLEHVKLLVTENIDKISTIESATEIHAEKLSKDVLSLSHDKWNEMPTPTTINKETFARQYVNDLLCHVVEIINEKAREEPDIIHSEMIQTFAKKCEEGTLRLVENISTIDEVSPLPDDNLSSNNVSFETEKKSLPEFTDVHSSNENVIISLLPTENVEATQPSSENEKKIPGGQSTEDAEHHLVRDFESNEILKQDNIPREDVPRHQTILDREIGLDHDGMYDEIELQRDYALPSDPEMKPTGSTCDDLSFYQTETEKEDGKAVDTMHESETEKESSMKMPTEAEKNKQKEATTNEDFQSSLPQSAAHDEVNEGGSSNIENEVKTHERENETSAPIDGEKDTTGDLSNKSEGQQNETIEVPSISETTPYEDYQNEVDKKGEVLEQSEKSEECVDISSAGEDVTSKSVKEIDEATVSKTVDKLEETKDQHETPIDNTLEEGQKEETEEKEKKQDVKESVGPLSPTEGDIQSAEIKDSLFKSSEDLIVDVLQSNDEREETSVERPVQPLQAVTSETVLPKVDDQTNMLEDDHLIVNRESGYADGQEYDELESEDSRTISTDNRSHDIGTTNEMLSYYQSDDILQNTDTPPQETIIRDDHQELESAGLKADETEGQFEERSTSHEGSNQDIYRPSTPNAEEQEANLTFGDSSNAQDHEETGKFIVSETEDISIEKGVEHGTIVLDSVDVANATESIDEPEMMVTIDETEAMKHVQELNVLNEDATEDKKKDTNVGEINGSLDGPSETEKNEDVKEDLVNDKSDDKETLSFEKHLDKEEAENILVEETLSSVNAVVNYSELSLEDEVTVDSKKDEITAEDTSTIIDHISPSPLPLNDLIMHNEVATHEDQIDNIKSVVIESETRDRVEDGVSHEEHHSEGVFSDVKYDTTEPHMTENIKEFGKDDGLFGIPQRQDVSSEDKEEETIDQKVEKQIPLGEEANISHVEEVLVEETGSKVDLTRADDGDRSGETSVQASDVSEHKNEEDMKVAILEVKTHPTEKQELVASGRVDSSVTKAGISEFEGIVHRENGHENGRTYDEVKSITFPGNQQNKEYPETREELSYYDNNDSEIRTQEQTMESDVTNMKENTGEVKKDDSSTSHIHGKEEDIEEIISTTNVDEKRDDIPAHVVDDISQTSLNEDVNTGHLKDIELKKSEEETHDKPSTDDFNLIKEGVKEIPSYTKEIFEKESLIETDKMKKSLENEEEYKNVDNEEDIKNKGVPSEELQAVEFDKDNRSFKTDLPNAEEEASDKSKDVDIENVTESKTNESRDLLDFIKKDEKEDEKVFESHEKVIEDSHVEDLHEETVKHVENMKIGSTNGVGDGNETNHVNGGNICCKGNEEDDGNTSDNTEFTDSEENVYKPIEESDRDADGVTQRLLGNYIEEESIDSIKEERIAHENQAFVFNEKSVEIDVDMSISDSKGELRMAVSADQTSIQTETEKISSSDLLEKALTYDSAETMKETEIDLTGPLGEKSTDEMQEDSRPESIHDVVEPKHETQQQLEMVIDNHEDIQLHEKDTTEEELPIEIDKDPEADKVQNANVPTDEALNKSSSVTFEYAETENQEKSIEVDHDKMVEETHLPMESIECHRGYEDGKPHEDIQSIITIPGGERSNDDLQLDDQTNVQEETGVKDVASVELTEIMENDENILEKSLTTDVDEKETVEEENPLTDVVTSHVVGEIEKKHSLTEEDTNESDEEGEKIEEEAQLPLYEPKIDADKTKEDVEVNKSEDSLKEQTMECKPLIPEESVAIHFNENAEDVDEIPLKDENTEKQKRNALTEENINKIEKNEEMTTQVESEFKDLHMSPREGIEDSKSEDVLKEETTKSDELIHEESVAPQVGEKYFVEEIPLDSSIKEDRHEMEGEDRMPMMETLMNATEKKGDSTESHTEDIESTKSEDTFQEEKNENEERILEESVDINIVEKEVISQTNEGPVFVNTEVLREVLIKENTNKIDEEEEMPMIVQSVQNEMEIDGEKEVLHVRPEDAFGEERIKVQECIPDKSVATTMQEKEEKWDNVSQEIVISKPTDALGEETSTREEFIHEDSLSLNRDVEETPLKHEDNFTEYHPQKSNAEKDEEVNETDQMEDKLDAGHPQYVESSNSGDALKEETIKCEERIPEELVVDNSNEKEDKEEEITLNYEVLSSENTEEQKKDASMEEKSDEIVIGKDTTMMGAQSHQEEIKIDSEKEDLPISLQEDNETSKSEDARKCEELTYGESLTTDTGKEDSLVVDIEGDPRTIYVEKDGIDEYMIQKISTPIHTIEDATDEAEVGSKTTNSEEDFEGEKIKSELVLEESVAKNEEDMKELSLVAETTPSVNTEGEMKDVLGPEATNIIDEEKDVMEEKESMTEIVQSPLNEMNVDDGKEKDLNISKMEDIPSNQADTLLKETPTKDEEFINEESLLTAVSEVDVVKEVPLKDTIEYLANSKSELSVDVSAEGEPPLNQMTGNVETKRKDSESDKFETILKEEVTISNEFSSAEFVEIKNNSETEMVSPGNAEVDNKDDILIEAEKHLIHEKRVVEGENQLLTDVIAIKLNELKNESKMEEHLNVSPAGDAENTPSDILCEETLGVEESLNTKIDKRESDMEEITLNEKIDLPAIVERESCTVDDMKEEDFEVMTQIVETLLNETEREAENEGEVLSVGDEEKMESSKLENVAKMTENVEAEDLANLETSTNTIMEIRDIEEVDVVTHVIGIALQHEEELKASRGEVTESHKSEDGVKEGGVPIETLDNSFAEVEQDKVDSYDKLREDISTEEMAVIEEKDKEIIHKDKLDEVRKVTVKEEDDLNSKALEDTESVKTMKVKEEKGLLEGEDRDSMSNDPLDTLRSINEVVDKSNNLEDTCMDKSIVENENKIHADKEDEIIKSSQSVEMKSLDIQTMQPHVDVSIEDNVRSYVEEEAKVISNLDMNVERDMDREESNVQEDAVAEESTVEMDPGVPLKMVDTIPNPVGNDNEVVTNTEDETMDIVNEVIEPVKLENVLASKHDLESVDYEVVDKENGHDEIQQPHETVDEISRNLVSGDGHEQDDLNSSQIEEENRFPSDSIPHQPTDFTLGEHTNDEIQSTTTPTYEQGNDTTLQSHDDESKQFSQPEETDIKHDGDGFDDKTKELKELSPEEPLISEMVEKEEYVEQPSNYEAVSSLNVHDGVSSVPGVIHDEQKEIEDEEMVENVIEFPLNETQTQVEKEDFNVSHVEDIEENKTEDALKAELDKCEDIKHEEPVSADISQKEDVEEFLSKNEVDSSVDVRHKKDIDLCNDEDRKGVETEEKAMKVMTPNDTENDVEKEVKDIADDSLKEDIMTVDVSHEESSPLDGNIQQVTEPDSLNKEEVNISTNEDLNVILKEKPFELKEEGAVKVDQISSNEVANDVDQEVDEFSASHVEEIINRKSAENLKEDLVECKEFSPEESSTLNVNVKEDMEDIETKDVLNSSPSAHAEEVQEDESSGIGEQEEVIANIMQTQQKAIQHAIEKTGEDLHMSHVEDIEKKISNDEEQIAKEEDQMTEVPHVVKDERDVRMDDSEARDSLAMDEEVDDNVHVDDQHNVIQESHENIASVDESVKNPIQDPVHELLKESQEEPMKDSKVEDFVEDPMKPEENVNFESTNGLEDESNHINDGNICCVGNEDDDNKSDDNTELTDIEESEEITQSEEEKDREMKNIPRKESLSEQVKSEGTGKENETFVLDENSMEGKADALEGAPVTDASPVELDEVVDIQKDSNFDYSSLEIIEKAVTLSEESVPFVVNDLHVSDDLVTDAISDSIENSDGDNVDDSGEFSVTDVQVKEELMSETKALIEEIGEGHYEDLMKDTTSLTGEVDVGESSVCGVVNKQVAGDDDVKSSHEKDIENEDIPNNNVDFADANKENFITKETDSTISEELTEHSTMLNDKPEEGNEMVVNKDEEEYIQIEMPPSDSLVSEEPVKTDMEDVVETTSFSKNEKDVEVNDIVDEDVENTFELVAEGVNEEVHTILDGEKETEQSEMIESQTQEVDETAPGNVLSEEVLQVDISASPIIESSKYDQGKESVEDVDENQEADLVLEASLEKPAHSESSIENAEVLHQRDLENTEIGETESDVKRDIVNNNDSPLSDITADETVSENSSSDKSFEIISAFENAPRELDRTESMDHKDEELEKTCLEEIEHVSSMPYQQEDIVDESSSNGNVEKDEKEGTMDITDEKENLNDDQEEEIEDFTTDKRNEECTEMASVESVLNLEEAFDVANGEQSQNNTTDEEENKTSQDLVSEIVMNEEGKEVKEKENDTIDEPKCEANQEIENLKMSSSDLIADSEEAVEDVQGDISSPKEPSQVVSRFDDVEREMDHSKSFEHEIKTIAENVSDVVENVSMLLLNDAILDESSNGKDVLGSEDEYEMVNPLADDVRNEDPQEINQDASENLEEHDVSQETTPSDILMPSEKENQDFVDIKVDSTFVRTDETAVEEEEENANLHEKGVDSGDILKEEIGNIVEELLASEAVCVTESVDNIEKIGCPEIPDVSSESHLDDLVEESFEAPIPPVDVQERPEESKQSDFETKHVSEEESCSKGEPSLETTHSSKDHVVSRESGVHDGQFYEESESEQHSTCPNITRDTEEDSSCYEFVPLEEKNENDEFTEVEPSNDSVLTSTDDALQNEPDITGADSSPLPSENFIERNDEIIDEVVDKHEEENVESIIKDVDTNMEKEEIENVILAPIEAEVSQGDEEFIVNNPHTDEEPREEVVTMEGDVRHEEKEADNENTDDLDLSAIQEELKKVISENEEDNGDEVEIRIAEMKECKLQHSKEIKQKKDVPSITRDEPSSEKCEDQEEETGRVNKLDSVSDEQEDYDVIELQTISQTNTQMDHKEAAENSVEESISTSEIIATTVNVNTESVQSSTGNEISEEKPPRGSGSDDYETWEYVGDKDMSELTDQDRADQTDVTSNDLQASEVLENFSMSFETSTTEPDVNEPIEPPKQHEEQIAEQIEEQLSKDEEPLESEKECETSDHQVSHLIDNDNLVEEDFVVVKEMKPQSTVNVMVEEEQSSEKNVTDNIYSQQPLQPVSTIDASHIDSESRSYSNVPVEDSFEPDEELQTEEPLNNVPEVTTNEDVSESASVLKELKDLLIKAECYRSHWPDVEALIGDLDEVNSKLQGTYVEGIDESEDEVKIWQTIRTELVAILRNQNTLGDNLQNLEQSAPYFGDAELEKNMADDEHCSEICKSMLDKLSEMEDDIALMKTKLEDIDSLTPEWNSGNIKNELDCLLDNINSWKERLLALDDILRILKECETDMQKVSKQTLQNNSFHKLSELKSILSKTCDGIHIVERRLDELPSLQIDRKIALQKRADDMKMKMVKSTEKIRHQVEDLGPDAEDAPPAPLWRTNDLYFGLICLIGFICFYFLSTSLQPTWSTSQGAPT